MKIRFIVNRSGELIAQRRCERGSRWIRTHREHAIACIVEGRASEFAREDSHGRKIPLVAELAERLRGSATQYAKVDDRDAFMRRQRHLWGIAFRSGKADAVRAMLAADTRIESRMWTTILIESEASPVHVEETIYCFRTLVSREDVYYVRSLYGRIECRTESQARDVLYEHGVNPEGIAVREVEAP